MSDVQDTIHVANTSQYRSSLTEQMGVPFSLARGLGCVEVSKCKIESIEDGSKIIEINGIPVRSLDYPVVKDVLASAEWPINLLLERPSKRELLPVLDK